MLSERLGFTQDQKDPTKTTASNEIIAQQRSHRETGSWLDSYILVQRYTAALSGFYHTYKCCYSPFVNGNSFNLPKRPEAKEEIVSF